MWPSPKQRWANLIDEYLLHFEGLVRAGERRERTSDKYAGDLRRHVVPALGQVPVQKLTVEHIARFMRQKQHDSPRSVASSSSRRTRSACSTATSARLAGHDGRSEPSAATRSARCWPPPRHSTVT